MFFKLLEFTVADLVTHQTLLDIREINSDVAHFYIYLPPMGQDLHLSTLFELIFKTKDSSAANCELPGILIYVEPK